MDIFRERMPEFAGVLLAVVVAACAWLAHAYQNQSDLVRHTLEVEKHISTLLAELQSAETGQRGYLLTRNDSFLDSYHQGASNVPVEVDTLHRLTADNSEQQQRLSKLKPLIDQRLQLLATRLQDLKTSSTVDFNSLKYGQDIMTKLRDGLAAMNEAEEHLLGQRLDRSAAYLRATTIGGLVAVLLASAIIGVWIRNSRLAAQQLRTANKELVQAIADLEAGEAKVRQMQKTEAIGQLTGGIAHDFNNMLGVVIGALGLAKKRLAKGDTDVGKFIDGALDGAGRAASLTKRLLAFSRQQPLSPQPLVANTLIAGMSDMIARTLGESIQTETVLAAGLWTMHADPALLENAVLNLAVNARDAMPEGGRLTIETGNAYLDEAYTRAYAEVGPGQYVMLAVSDTGSGMSAATIAKAFDPFFTTKAAGLGTGLGLSQVHGFVKQSGGHIKIYSEPGSGTTVKMYFPRFTVSGRQEPEAVSEGRAALRRQSVGEQLILVVEDDARVRETTVAMLRDMGYPVIHVDGATAALREIDSNRTITLLFTDIVMPEINGRKLADEAVKRRPGLKVLFTTGFTRNAVVHNGILDTGVNLLQKPFTLDQLERKLNEMLGDGV